MKNNLFKEIINGFPYEFKPELEGQAIFVEGHDEYDVDRTGVYLVQEVHYGTITALDYLGRQSKFYTIQFPVDETDEDAMLKMRVLS